MWQRTSFVLGFLVGIAPTSQCSHAQYTADFQTNIISGVTSNWSGVDYIVGDTNFGDALLLQSGGVLSNGVGFLGFNIGSSNNSALVTDNGSVWSNRWGFYVGFSGAGNELVISNGGQMVSDPSGSLNYSDYIGFNTSSSNNIVLVTGPGSAWNDGVRLYVGYSGANNSLVISGGGALSSSLGYLGYGVSASNNAVVVTGSGSVWSNASSLSIGYRGVGNSLTITNGGTVFSAGGSVGNGDGALSSSNNWVRVTGSGSTWNNSGSMTVGFAEPNNNVLVVSGGGQVLSSSASIGRSSEGNPVLVTDAGSVWSNTGTFTVGGGYLGAGGSLVISNNGQVIDATAYVGLGSLNSNSVRVVDGALWQNDILYVGYQGSSNSLVIVDSALSGMTKVLATNVVIGVASATCDNLLDVESGDLIVTNSAGTGVLEVRNGQLIVNGGLVRADTLVVTNPCASLLHTGGSLIVSNLVLDPNSFQITSITHQTNDLLITWMMGPGITNTLQVTTGAPDGSYDTNGFTDVVVITNNAVAGVVTNYTDHGAATNGPGRYYRARLIP